MAISSPIVVYTLLLTKGLLGIAITAIMIIGVMGIVESLRYGSNDRGWYVGLVLAGFVFAIVLARLPT